MDDPADPDLAGELAGGTEGLLAVHDAIAAELYAYATFLLAPARHATDDGPAEAVLDALLVAGETAGELVDPALSRAWLHALTRNECLRRRPAAWPAAEAEAAELAGRAGLAAAEVAAVLGRAVRPVADAAPVPVPAPPGWLRAELAAALGVEAAGRRAELARRAHPFDPDGFPVPVDLRRLSARALAWSVAAVVLIALGLLVSLPPGGSTGGLPGPALAAAAAPEDAADATAPAPLPTLAAPAVGAAPVTTSASSRPQPAPDRGADRRPVAAVPATQQRAGGSAGGDLGGSRTALQVTVRADGDCGDSWTADVRVHAYRDQATITRVTASAAGGSAVLAGGGGRWTGELAGLPADRAVTVTVTASDGAGATVGSESRQVEPGC